jgi:hypothetical protein
MIPNSTTDWPSGLEFFPLHMVKDVGAALPLLHQQLTICILAVAISQCNPSTDQKIH